MKKVAIFVSIAVGLFSFSMSGCMGNISNIEKISYDGLTLRVSANELNSRLQDLFPIISNLQYGSIELSNPKAILKKGSNRLTTGTAITYQNDNLPTQKGSLYISGSPYFDGQSGAIYLKRPKIEKMQFNGVDLFDFVKKPIVDALQPQIDQIFETHPIYQLDRSKLQNKFIKNVYIDDGALLITFGF